MARSFKYAVLQAIPDPRRGERVNIGIAIFLPDRVDVQFKELGKIRAISRESWDQYLEEARDRFIQSHEQKNAPEDIIERFMSVERGVRCSDLGWFTVGTPDQYDQRVSEILDALVLRPRPPSRPKRTRINTEISREFRRVKVLATPEETIEDRKIVRDFSIDEPEELRADFALKNGKYHVATTLDLRLAHVDYGQAALKAIVLDKAGERFKRNVKKIGVYAANSHADQYKNHVALLRDYADEVYNWSEPQERKAFTRYIYAALDLTGPLT